MRARTHTHTHSCLAILCEVWLLSPDLKYCIVLTDIVVSLAERKECPSTLSPHVPPTKEWVLTDMHLVDKSQRGLVDRGRGKLDRLNQNNQQSLQEVQARAQNAESRARESDRRAQDAESRAQELERRAQEVEARAQEVEARAQEVDMRIQEVEVRAMQVERRGELLQQEREGEGEREWLVERREIDVTWESLGEGGWGEVRVAEFRGSQVAAKVLHRQLQSPYYRNTFRREMNMAAKVRHPNLVQFLGASMDQEKVILMELMTTSLRQHIEVNPPSLPFSTAVSLDVAKALNYLHLMQPEAILHRDISSANVLLAPLPDNHWRAKVTDYGSVNLQNLLNTKNPGCLTYAAPEAHSPSLQTPKMDIFSFGVLMVEMCTCRFPDTRDRENLIRGIEDRRWVGLIRQCTHQDKEGRPTAAQIIARITSWQ